LTVPVAIIFVLREGGGKIPTFGPSGVGCSKTATSEEHGLSTARTA
jgi:hypothetical protein